MMYMRNKYIIGSSCYKAIRRQKSNIRYVKITCVFGVFLALISKKWVQILQNTVYTHINVLKYAKMSLLNYMCTHVLYMYCYVQCSCQFHISV